MSRGDELAQVGDIFLFASTWLALALVVCSGVQGRLRHPSVRNPEKSAFPSAP